MNNRIFVDIDKTICFTNGMSYENAVPNVKNIKKVNDLYDEGYIITMWTARGSLSNKCFFSITQKQLKNWGVKYHELRMGKPAYDLLIDDKTINSIWNWDNNSVNNVLNNKILEKFIIIIQARTSSTRYRNKILKPFYKEKNILDIMLERLSKNKFNIPVVIATTNNSNDDIIYKKYHKKYECFRGSENNVLDRFIQCAKKYGKEYVIRVCSDNPFLSLNYLENLIENFLENDCDYLSYTMDGKLPTIKTHIGIFPEIVKLDSLKEVLNRTSDKLYLEHVTNYIYSHEGFNCNLLKVRFNFKKIDMVRLTVDNESDFNITKFIYEKIINKENINIYEIFSILMDNTEYFNLMEENINKNKK